MAGLGPEDVSRALQGALGIEQLKQQSFRDAVNAAYMGAQIQQMGAVSPEDRPFAGGYSLREFKALTPDMKERTLYTVAQAQAKAMGDEKFMSLEEWKGLDKTSKMQFLEEILESDDPRVKELAKEIYGPTRISIGEKAATAGAVTTAREAAKAGGAVRNLVRSGGLPDAINKYISSDEVQEMLMNVPGKGSEYRENREKLLKAATKNRIENMLITGGAEILDFREEDRTGIWTVRWLDGSEMEVPYAF